MKYFVKSKLSENIHETPEGYLLCIAVPIARTGEMVYGEGETPLDANEDGEILIRREEEEVFSDKTIASFEGKPVTITHPTEFVDPSNWKTLACGIIQNVRRGSGEQKDSLIADLLITDSIAIGLVKSGLREVSCGYEAQYAQEGEGRGIQTQIRGNHLALVEQGRAGSAYAIQDHKAIKGAKNMSFKDKYKALVAKFTDEAGKLAEDEFPEKKDDKSKDEEKESKDAGAYDELVKMIDALGEKVSAMAKPKDKEKEAKDDDSGMEDRMKACEAALEKILEKMGAMDEDDEDESEDEDMGSVVGDTASRAEILAPGLVATKDVKVKALKACYATKDGEKIIKALNGGKAPTYDSKDSVAKLFIAASEVLKATRTNELSGTKKTFDTQTRDQGPMTPERLNEINAKHYSQRN